MILTGNDILGIVLVFAYILVVFVIVEKVWKGDRATGRKILHISMGNIVFILWIMNSRRVEVLLAMGVSLVRFLVIDGLDGSGKDTQALKLKKYLSKDGEDIVLRVHPSQDNALAARRKKRSWAAVS